MKSFLLKRENIIFVIILLAGAVLRFYNYADFSLSNDELSALNRARYDTFHELVEHGVAELDNHPAGVQVFIYYWINAFGNSPASLRFPFVITGIFSILFAYLIGKRWFGKTAGLYTAAAIAFLEFPLLYSQIARPYSFGLCFTLAFTWFWTRFLVDEKHRSKSVITGYILFGTFALYAHYFAGLTAIITGITGLFFLKRKNYLPYLLCGLTIGILFLPHLGIFTEQISKGGLSWIAAPTPSYFKDFIFTSLNESWIILSVIALVIVACLTIRKTIPFSKFQIITLTWFLSPFIVGYLYSIYNTPVLRDAVLLFCFPYFILFLFSFLKDFPLNKFSTLLLALFGTAALYSTTVENDYYGDYHFGDFKGVAHTTKELSEEYGKENLTRIINTIHPYYIHYYLNDSSILFDQYIIQDEKDLQLLSEKIERSNTPYCLFAYLNIYNPPEVIELIRRKYPVKDRHVKLHNMSGIQVFKKGKGRKDLVFKSKNDFEHEYGHWDKGLEAYQDSIAKSGTRSQRLDTAHAYSSTLRMPARKVFGKKGKFITVSANCYFPRDIDEGNLVVSIDRNGKNIHWFGTPVKDWVNTSQQWQEVFTCHPVPDNLKEGDILAVYLWNNGKEVFYVDDIRISVFSDPHHYSDN